MGSRSLRKGKAFERQLAAEIREAWGVDARRNLDQWRSGGTDLLVPWRPVDLPPFPHVGAQIPKNIRAWYNQAIGAAPPNSAPLLVFKADRRVPLVVLPLQSRQIGWTAYAIEAKCRKSLKYPLLGFYDDGALILEWKTFLASGVL